MKNASIDRKSFCHVEVETKEQKTMKKIKLTIAVAFLAAVSIAPIARALESWDREGDAHGTISAIVIKSWIPGSKQAFAATRGSGIFFSANGGASWIERNNGLDGYDVVGLARATVTGELFAATNAGVFRSCDDGANWADFSGKGATGLTTFDLTSIVAVEKSGGAVIDVLVGSRGTGIHRRTINGVSCPAAGETIGNWCSFSGGISAGVDADGFSYRDVLALGNDGTKIYAATLEASYPGGGTTPQRGNVYSIDILDITSCTATWSPRFGCNGCPPLQGKTFRSIKARNDASSGTQVFAGTNGGWLWQIDGNAAPALPCAGFLPVDAASREIRSIEYLPGGNAPSGSYNPQLLVAADDGFHLTDLGDCRGSAGQVNVLSKAFDGRATVSVFQPVLSAVAQPAAFLGSEGQGLFEIDALNAVSPLPAVPATTGIDDFSVSAISFSPAWGGSAPGPGGAPINDRTIFVASASEGLYKTVDGSYFTRVNGLPQGRDWTAAVAIVPDWSYAEFGSIDAYASPNNLTVWAATRDLGVLKSRDGGLTWDFSNGVVPSVSLPTQPSAQALVESRTGTLLASIVGHGIWRSTDGGDSWNHLAPVRADGDNGTGREVYAIGIGAYFQSGSSGDPTIVAATNDGVYVSTNGGFNWIRRSNGFPGATGVVRTLTLAPDFDGTVTTCGNGSSCSTGLCFRQSIWAGLEGGGIWFSANTALTWQEVGGGAAGIPDDSTVSSIKLSQNWPGDGIVLASAVDVGVFYLNGAEGSCPVTFNDDGGDTGFSQMSLGTGWAFTPSEGNNGPKGYKIGAYTNNLCGALTSPAIFLGKDPRLEFSSAYDIEGNYDKGIVEIATLPDYSNWTKVPVNYPDNPSQPGDACGDGPGAAFSRTIASPSWNTYSGSLLAWRDQWIKIRFRLSTDLSVTRAGWWIDEIRVLPQWKSASNSSSNPTDPADLSILSLGIPPGFPSSDPSVYAGSAVRRLNRARFGDPFPTNSDCGGTTIWCELGGFYSVPPNIQAVTTLTAGDPDSTVVFAGTRDFGVFASFNSGETWAPWDQGLFPSGGAAWPNYPARNILSIAASAPNVSSGERTIVAGTAYQGLFRGGYNGETIRPSWKQGWFDGNGDCSAPTAPADHRLDNGSVATVRWDNERAQFFAGSTTEKALLSCDGITGYVWQAMAPGGLPSGLLAIYPDASTYGGLAGKGDDPRILPTKMSVWGASGGSAPSLADKESESGGRSGRSRISSSPNGVYGYDGSSWVSKSGTGSAALPSTENYQAVTTVNDPFFSGNTHQNILAGSNNALYLTANDGETWQNVTPLIRCSSGTVPSQVDVRAFAKTTAPDGIIVAIASQSPNCSVGRTGGVYWSDDGGYAWVDITANLSVAAALDLTRGNDVPATYYGGFTVDGVQSRNFTSYSGAPRSYFTSSPNCGGDPNDRQFVDRTAGRQITDTTSWDFGGAGTCVTPGSGCASVRNPIFRYSAPGAYAVRVRTTRAATNYDHTANVSVPETEFSLLPSFRKNGSNIDMSWTAIGDYAWPVDRYEIRGSATAAGPATTIKCLGSACSAPLGTSTILTPAEQASYGFFKVRLVATDDPCGGEPAW